MKTLNANSFNFVAPDLVSGVHTIEVQARSSAAASSTGTNGSLGNANAFIGAGSVAIEAVRMIKDEQVEFNRIVCTTKGNQKGGVTEIP